MPRRKPIGWPRYMEEKRTKGGATAYYWNVPTWARKASSPFANEPLGTDYAEAKRRCDEILNPQLDAWRTGRSVTDISDRLVIGTVDWLFATYKSSPKYRGKSAKTRKSYDYGMNMVSKFALKDGRTFGSLSLKSVTEGAADRLYAKLQVKEDGSERNRSAVLAMVVCKRAWHVARREKPDIVPVVNPFAKMDLSHKSKATRAVNSEELMRLVAAADAAGEASIGTAAMIAFYWLQRQTDIIGRLTWGHYRPAESPRTVNIFHHKTGELVPMPLYDDDGTELWPELMARLDHAPRYGTLIVMRETPDRRRKVNLPWREDYFRHRFAALRLKAGIASEVKFMGMRHGGNTEAADADLTDAQLRALSGHRTTAALLRYAQVTDKQRRVGARKRLDSRTKKEGLSE